MEQWVPDNVFFFFNLSSRNAYYDDSSANSHYVKTNVEVKRKTIHYYMAFG